MPRDDKRISKFMSLVLRHRPEVAELELDAAGYVAVDDLLAALAAKGLALTRQDLDAVVASNDKKRFAFDETGARIRAVQGHSIDVDLGYAPAAPPERLFHGTVGRFLESIGTEGLKPGGRQFVHLSPDRETATAVGSRRGKPVVLVVAAGRMAGEGHLFYLASNGVWLTDRVPPEFIEFPE